MNMATYIYQCPACGFVYPVPDYWASFSPEETMDFPHVRLDTREMCGETLVLKESDEG